MCGQSSMAELDPRRRPSDTLQTRVAHSLRGHPLPALKYAAIAFIVIAATTVLASLGRLWRHRSAHGYEVGNVSERWLSEIRREDES